MNHKQLVQQLNDMKSEIDTLKGQVASYENVETEIVTAPAINSNTSRRRMLKRMAIGAGAFAAAAAAGALSTGGQVLAETASSNAIDAQGGTGGYGITTSVASGGLAPLRLAPGSAAGAPSSFTGRNAGELYVDSAGSLYFLAATNGTSTGSWRKVAAGNTYGDANSHIQPGSYFLLPASDRFVDTRGLNGNALGISIGTRTSGGSAGAGYATNNITGTPGRSSLQIPAGATAVTGNVTVVVRSGTYNGAIKVLPGNTTDLSKGAATVAYSGSTANVAFSNSFVSPLSSGTLKFALYSFSGSDYSADVIIDITGYYL